MGTTFLKRQKEMKRMEKQRAKAERRAQKKIAGRAPTDEFGEIIGADAGESPNEPEEVAPETSSPV
jgi:hypothetical protein